MNYPYIKKHSMWELKEMDNGLRSARLIPYIVIAVMLLGLIILLCMPKKAQAQVIPNPTYTASYYTYRSCVREGTSGVWTASGERFNENDLTAAMWGVRFSTLVKVTNLTNGKTVIVRINDRGPSKRLVRKGRIIDLSKGAFLRIADLKRGVINVKVEVLDAQ